MFIISDLWHTINEIDSYYITIHPKLNITAAALILSPGRTYRLSVRFCADDVCFHPLKTSGVTIIPSKPVAGFLSIEYTNHTETEDKVKLSSCIWREYIEIYQTLYFGKQVNNGKQ